MKIVELMMRETLPQKDFFGASEITTLIGVSPEEIREWETEFPQIRVHKNGQGQKIYRRKDVMLLYAVKHLVNENNLKLPEVQKILAESTTAELDDVPMIGHDHTLQEASRFLDEESVEFDERRHHVYQQCSEELANAKVEVDPREVGEMIQDGLVAVASKPSSRLMRADYEKAFARLMASKISLTEVLTMLDKISESNFWHGFEECRSTPEQPLDRLSRHL